jgi:tetratricopeptide (TPR) repeat protein
MKSVRSMASRGILACFLLVMFALSSCVSSPEAKSARFIEAGKKMLQNKDAPRAILQFRNATQATPKNAEAFYQLGLAYLAAGDLRNGVGNLRKAVDVDPKHTGAQLRLAQLMSDANNPDIVKDAQQRLEKLWQEGAETPDVLHALALTELKLGDTAEAMRHLDMAISSAPQELMIAITLAQAKLQQKDAKGAEAVLLKACESSPKSVDAVIVLGQFYFSQNRTTEAEQQFEKALAMDPNHGGALLNLATLQNQTGKKAEAEQSLKRLSTIASYKPMYGIFLFQAGRKDEAVREFERLTKEDPSDRAARTRLVAVYRNMNRDADAEKVLSQALANNPKDAEALMQRGEMFLAAGKYEQAETDLNQVLHLEPGSASVHYVVAKLNRDRGKDAAYREQLFKALSLNSYLLRARIELAQALLQSKNAQAALDLLNDTPQSQKSSLDVLAGRNWLLWTMGDLAGMRKGIDAGLARGRSAEFLIQDGLWKSRTGNPAGAEASLQAALNVDPSNVLALQALSNTLAEQKTPSLALEKVKEYATREPKSAPVHILLGELLLAKGDRAQARAAYAAAKAADPQSVEADLDLAKVDSLENKYDDAQGRLRAIIAANPDQPTAHLWLGAIELKLGNHTAAIEDFRKVLGATPDNPLAANDLAYLLAEHTENLAEALKYAQRAVELAPGQTSYADTLGWVLYRRGQYPSAVQYLVRAAKDPANAVAKYHLAMAYAKAGDHVRSYATLQAALNLDPNRPEAKVAQEIVGASH